MRDILTKNEKKALALLAEDVCTIEPGEKVGKWTREDRVMLIYTVLCKLYRAGKLRDKEKKKNNG